MSMSKCSNPNLATAIKKMYLDKSTADVHFTFDSGSGNVERVPAHKSFLVATSKVFRAMFSGSWKENDDVSIVDASPAAFKEFLQFFYCAEVKITTENVEEVLLLSQKYLVAACSNACAQLLMKNVTNENVCSVYGLSILADQKELINQCEVTIGVDAIEVFKTTGFLECDRQVLSHILKLDSISCSEVDVFNACLEWTKAASKQNDLNKETVTTHLGDLIYDIRFGAMTIDEVNGIFASHENLFTAKERTEIIKVIKSKRIASTKFKKHPREWQWEGKPVLECMRKVQETYWRYFKKIDLRMYVIREPEFSTFSTNCVLLLRAVVCAKVYILLKFNFMQVLGFDIENAQLTIIERHDEDQNDIDDSYSARQKVKDRILSIISGKKPNADLEEGGSKEEEKSKILYTDDNVTLIGDQTTVINLTKPILIKPEFNYTICMDLGDDGGYPFCTDFKLQNTAVKMKDGITVNFSQDAKDSGTLRNLIYGLHFSKV